MLGTPLADVLVMAHRYSVFALPEPLPVLRFSVSVADLIVVPDRMILSVLNHMQP